MIAALVVVAVLVASWAVYRWIDRWALRRDSADRVSVRPETYEVPNELGTSCEEPMGEEGGLRTIVPPGDLATGARERSRTPSDEPEFHKTGLSD